MGIGPSEVCYRCLICAYCRRSPRLTPRPKADLTLKARVIAGGV
jgi:hypothetical protein